MVNKSVTEEVLFSKALVWRSDKLVWTLAVLSAADSISQSQSLSEGKTLVSADGSFEFGFFSPGSSANRFLGIWYKAIPVKTVVWVANRSNPVKDNSSMLHINSEGNPVLVNNNGTLIWSAESRKKALNPIVQLLNSGNLVLRDERDEDPQNYLWQSFDYPCGTLLPGMKLGWDLKTDLDRRVSAWKNWDDPSPGDFKWGISLEGVPQVMMWKGSQEYYRGGIWNGLGFSGAPELKNNPLFEFEFVSNKDEVYYTYSLRNKSMISRVVLNQTSYTRQRYIWIQEAKTWRIYASVPRDNCDFYNLCGPYGNCIIGDSPVCQCLTGFMPRSQKNWDNMDWTEGCLLTQQWSCKDKSQNGFLKFSGVKYPDTSHSWVNERMNTNECRGKCLENCSCKAYANSDVRNGGSGCLLWFGDLRDIRQFSGGVQDLYIRTKISELGVKREHNIKVVAIITIAAAVFMVILGLLYYVCKRMKKSRVDETEDTLRVQNNEESENEDLQLPFFDLAVIAKATDGFSINNKLGEGGFGVVYRGTLADGQEIAVKRLSQSSGQGFNEFKNEVILIAKLQHRNLVKLLGCCIQGEEKMLIYEYMPNKSLDFFIFDHAKGEVLDWPKRFNIICGISRGLVYLHQDSRLRIIHRDLKASNVLLDSELNPKISDFGLARTFGGNQTEGNTRRVVGTYGYMAPEYAIHGLFSVKSDVFSFGVILLEIVTGKKNRGFSHSSNSIDLIGHAWRFWKENKPLDLIDPRMEKYLSDLSEALRCIHISLLCVQQHPEDRPNMSTVVVMLSSESALPQPKEPAFLIDKSFLEADSSTKHPSSSTNEISVTMLEPR
ncbi:G-type lectin S-receptor-like serine/threonine-protein kinase At4g27290 isoform X2 [Lotus japonicus]|uniref:G-type lectin S-receptor-like serine/threonine-protein kinase At4g27290 isoform X2 n=1 Tax=Lotus japonicus TaxID=34305 RepID=UPI002588AFEC|nr:G-type lectin S-receptor-like serine/threonine-protein kinase At4g27290 isoform X2 [Lotus japonicus]